MPSDVTVDNYFAYNHIGIAYDSDAKEIGRLDEKAADQLFKDMSKYFDGPPKERRSRAAARLRPTIAASENFTAAARKAQPPAKANVVVRLLGRCLPVNHRHQARLRFRQQQPGGLLCPAGPTRGPRPAEKYFRARVDVQSALCRRLQQSGHRARGAGRRTGREKQDYRRAQEVRRGHLLPSAGSQRTHRPGLGPQQSLPRLLAEIRPGKSSGAISRHAESDLHYAMDGKRLRVAAVRSELPGRLDEPGGNPHARQNDLEGPQGAAACTRRMVDIDPTATEGPSKRR